MSCKRVNESMTSNPTTRKHVYMWYLRVLVKLRQKTALLNISRPILQRKKSIFSQVSVLEGKKKD